MIQQFERWNRVIPEVFVIPWEESALGRNKRWRTHEDSAIVFDSYNGFPKPAEFPSCDQEEGEPSMAGVSTGVIVDELPVEEVCLKSWLLQEELCMQLTSGFGVVTLEAGSQNQFIVGIPIYY
jgi:hypothetical protein